VDPVGVAADILARPLCTVSSRKEVIRTSCCRGFSEVVHAFLAKALLNSPVGQPLGQQILGALGPPTGFVS
jgi:hypothetical protein